LGLLLARCRLTPTVLLLEDLHWIDTASEELLLKIVNAPAPLTLLVLHTRRPEYRPLWTDRSHVTVLTPDRLSAADTSRIVQRRLGLSDLPAALADVIAERADGNPLFAEEIAGYLLERGVVQQGVSGVQFDPAAVQGALPTSIQSLLAARVDQLATNDR